VETLRDESTPAPTGATSPCTECDDGERDSPKHAIDADSALDFRQIEEDPAPAPNRDDYGLREGDVPDEPSPDEGAHEAASESGEAPKKRTAHPISILLVTLGAFAIALLCNGGALVAWADGIEDSAIKSFMRPIADAIAWPGAALGIDQPVKGLRAWFLPYARTKDMEALETYVAGVAAGEAAGVAAGGANDVEIGSAGDASDPAGAPSDAASAKPDAGGDSEAASPAESATGIKIASAAATVATGAGYTLGVIPDAATSLRYRAKAGYYSPKNPLKVLLVGDSMAKLGTADALLEWDRVTDWATVAVSTKVSSSLSNPKAIDWHAHIRSLTAEAAYDLVIVFLGSNEAQGISDGRRAYDFNTPDWFSVWDSRATDFLGVLSDRSWKVYWTAVPPMRKEGYKQRMITLNEHCRELVRSFANVRFVDTSSALGDGNGLYVDAKIVDGAQRIIRHSDGIHMDIWGAILLVREYERMILEDFYIEGVNYHPEQVPETVE
jgi:hypothetical protein